MDGLAARVPEHERATVTAEAELQLLRQENRRLRLEADNFRETAQLVLNEPDTRGLAQSLARQFGLVLGAESAWVLVLYDRETIAHGVWPQSGLAKEPAPELEFGKHAAGRAAKSLETSIQPGSAGGWEIATPIVDHQRRLLGLLQARCHEKFSPEHARVVGAFAVQAALGLERARLFDRMRDWTKSLEMLLSFNAVINQHVEPAQLVRRLVENAARFLEADGGRTGLAVPTPVANGKAMISDAYWHHGHWQERHRRWR